MTRDEVVAALLLMGFVCDGYKGLESDRWFRINGPRGGGIRILEDAQIRLGEAFQQRELGKGEHYTRRLTVTFEEFLLMWEARHDKR